LASVGEHCGSWKGCQTFRKTNNRFDMVVIANEEKENNNKEIHRAAKIRQSMAREETSHIKR